MTNIEMLENTLPIAPETDCYGELQTSGTEGK